VPATLEEDAPDRALLADLAARIAPEDLQLYYQIAVQGRADIGYAPDDFAGFTMTLMRMLAFAPGAAAAVRPAAAAGPAALAPREMRAAVDSKKNADVDLGWIELLGQLKLTGMARRLAEHCELVAREATRIELRIAQTHQHLLEKQYLDRLKAALEERFGTTLRLAITVADRAGSAPAAIADREREDNQAKAVAAIEQDPFVRELVENFDARVVESTIRPVQEK
jgi:DNA polymerase-3 subunit gamma/tau